MVAACVALGCKNKFKRGSNLSFHSFPSDPKIREFWLKSIGRPDFVPTDASKVCSAHFPKSNFIYNFGLKKLKPECIPCIFNNKEDLNQPSTSKEKNPSIEDQLMAMEGSEENDSEEVDSQLATHIIDMTTEPETITYIIEDTEDSAIEDTQVPQFYLKQQQTPFKKVIINSPLVKVHRNTPNILNRAKPIPTKQIQSSQQIAKTPTTLATLEKHARTPITLATLEKHARTPITLATLEKHAKTPITLATVEKHAKTPITLATLEMQQNGKEKPKEVSERTPQKTPNKADVVVIIVDDSLEQELHEKGTGVLVFKSDLTDLRLKSSNSITIVENSVKEPEPLTPTERLAQLKKSRLEGEMALHRSLFPGRPFIDPEKMREMWRLSATLARKQKREIKQLTGKVFRFKKREQSLYDEMMKMINEDLNEENDNDDNIIEEDFGHVTEEIFDENFSIEQMDCN